MGPTEEELNEAAAEDVENLLESYFMQARMGVCLCVRAVCLRARCVCCAWGDRARALPIPRTSLMRTSLMRTSLMRTSLMRTHTPA